MTENEWGQPGGRVPRAQGDWTAGRDTSGEKMRRPHAAIVKLATSDQVSATRPNIGHTWPAVFKNRKVGNLES